MKNTLVALVILLALALSACAGVGAPNEPQLEITDVWARSNVGGGMEGMEGGAMEGMEGEATEGAMESGEMQPAEDTGVKITGAFMTIRNTGRQADRLLSVESDVAEVIETHTTEMRNGVAAMARIDGIDIPGLKTTELKPGGLHIMLIRLTRDLMPGDVVNLRLNFEVSGPIDVQAEVRAP